jgi:hypothetical protein
MNFNEEIENMCSKLNCCINPENCLYSTDRYLNDHDCDGPYIEEDKKYALETKN